MPLWPTTPKAIRSKIASYRRILRREYERFGMWGDGYGKRLWLFPLYFLLRDDDEAGPFIDWYVATFPDDRYDVSQCVCWALILRRLGREDEAVYRLVQGIRENLPAVAKVVDDYQWPYGMWGEEVLRFSDLSADLTEAMTDDERRWLMSAWDLPAVAAMRQRRIAIGRALVTVTAREERVVLLNEQCALVQAFRSSEMEPLPLDSSGETWLSGGRMSARRRSSTVIRPSPDAWKR